MANNENLSQLQREVQKYIERHQLEELLSDLLNSLVHCRHEKPIIYMIKYLANFVNPSDLQEHGIIIPGPYPTLDLSIAYPKFDKKSKSLFKNILTPEVFMANKNKRTPRYVSLREIIDIGLEEKNHKIGILAPDEDSYITFSDIFNPILEELNGVIISELASSIGYGTQNDTLIKRESILHSAETAYIKNLKLKVRRNLKGHAFNSILKEEERAEIHQKIHTEILKLGENFNKFHDLTKINKKTQDILKKEFNYGKYINAVKVSSMKFKDWPSSRSIYLSQDENLCIFINKEDHLEIKYNLTKDIDVGLAYSSMLSFANYLENNLPFSYDPKLGYISTNPKYVGNGLRIKLRIAIPNNLSSVFRKNLESINLDPSLLKIKESDPAQGIWKIKSQKCMGLNDLEFINFIENTIHALLNDIVSIEELKKIISKPKESVWTKRFETNQVSKPDEKSAITGELLSTSIKAEQDEIPKKEIGLDNTEIKNITSPKSIGTLQITNRSVNLPNNEHQVAELVSIRQNSHSSMSRRESRNDLNNEIEIRKSNTSLHSQVNSAKRSYVGGVNNQELKKDPSNLVHSSSKGSNAEKSGIEEKFKLNKDNKDIIENESAKSLKSFPTQNSHEIIKKSLDEIQSQPNQNIDNRSLDGSNLELKSKNDLNAQENSHLHQDEFKKSVEDFELSYSQNIPNKSIIESHLIEGQSIIKKTLSEIGEAENNNQALEDGSYIIQDHAAESNLEESQNEQNPECKINPVLEDSSAVYE